MMVLDTDHLSVLTDQRNAKCDRLKLRLEASHEKVAAPIVAIEEQCRGWLGKIASQPDVEDQVFGYKRFANLFEFYADWDIELFDNRAALEFKRLRKQKVRIGTRDLKIAAIALVNDALLLSANLRDFRKVPNLRVENWLE